MKGNGCFSVLRWPSRSSTKPQIGHDCAPAQKQRQDGVRTTPHKAGTKSSSKDHAQPTFCNFVRAGSRPDEYTTAQSGRAIEKVLTRRPSCSSSSLASCGRSESVDSSASSSSSDHPSTNSVAFLHSRNSLFKPVRALGANGERMRLPRPQPVPPTRRSASPKPTPAGLRQRTSDSSQARPEEHPETGLSSQVAADKKMLLSGRRLRPVSKTERVAMSYWLTVWSNDTVSTASTVNSGAGAKMIDRRRPSPHNKRYQKRGPPLADSASKQSCTSSKSPSTSEVSVELSAWLSEQSVAHLHSDHSSRLDEHVTHVSPWRKMGLQVAIEPANKPRKPKAHVTWSDSPSQKVSYSREKKLERWYLNRNCNRNCSTTVVRN